MKGLGYALLAISGFIIVVYFLNQAAIEEIFGDDAGFLAILFSVFLFIPGILLLYKSRNMTSY